MNISVYFRNCLKAVILLCTCIIAFHASVTAFVVQDFNISAIKVNSRGGLLKTFDVFFQRIRNEENQHLFDEVFGTPEGMWKFLCKTVKTTLYLYYIDYYNVIEYFLATYGPTQHITRYFDRKMFVEKFGDLSEKRGKWMSLWCTVGYKWVIV